jgi:sugar/nucleoside kinase (ribokinase family)
LEAEVPRPEFDIFGLGTIAVDDCLYVDSYPPPDQKVRINREGRNVGGQIATALAAASRLGAHCAYAAVLGEDELSTAAFDALRTAGVDCRFVQRSPGAGPIHSVIIVDEKSSTRNIFYDVSRTVPVPANQISPATMGNTRVLLVDQFGPDTAIHAARLAHRTGAAVVMDLEWLDAPRLDEMMLLSDHLLVPRDFAAAYTGSSTPALAAEELHRRNPRACTAVTCGTDGCYFLHASAPVQHLPAPRVESLETTGCGDVFHGAYAAALAGGKEILDCLRFASAAAAVFATRPSGWQNLPTADDVNRLMTKTYSRRFE